MKIFLWVVLAGALGTASRFLLTRYINHLFPDFPWGTLAVNLIGTFAAGFLFFVFRANLKHLDAYTPILFIGFLGAFTTFSAYAIESLHLILQGQYLKGLFNILIQNITGIGAAYSGIVLAKLLFR